MVLLKDNTLVGPHMFEHLSLKTNHWPLKLGLYMEMIFMLLAIHTTFVEGQVFM
jgi:hypothetical protein